MQHDLFQIYYKHERLQQPGALLTRSLSGGFCDRQDLLKPDEDIGREQGTRLLEIIERAVVGDKD
ncbi:MAG: hypothetical protein JKY43_11895 [Phycisphaerales bacterium]|nr:hypothetical protein [Phycisphaerales bacterium]